VRLRKIKCSALLLDCTHGSALKRTMAKLVILNARTEEVNADRDDVAGGMPC
jgi:hypothetical protein